MPSKRLKQKKALIELTEMEDTDYTTRDIYSNIQIQLSWLSIKELKVLLQVLKIMTGK